MVISSVVFSTRPSVALPINAGLLFILFVSQVALQPCLGFGLTVNNFRAAFFFVEFSTHVFAILAQFIPEYAEVFVILTIPFCICSGIVVYFCNAPRARSKSLPKYPLMRLLIGFNTDTRLKVCLCVVDFQKGRACKYDVKSGITVVNVLDFTNPIRITVHFIKKNMRNSVSIKVFYKFKQFVSAKPNIVKRNIKRIVSVRESKFYVLQQHCGFTHAACAFNADKRLIPVN